MNILNEIVPGLASGKLRQIFFGIPTYFQQVTQLRSRRSFYRWLYFKLPYLFSIVDFPQFIILSVTTHCNLSCPHCFRNVMHWRPHDMELPLFEKILDEIAIHPECTLKLGGLGEPSVHPQIRDFIFLLAKKKIPAIIYTNGTLFERFAPHEIVDLGIKRIVVSIDGIDSQSYKAKRVGGNYATLRANVARLYQTREEMKSRLPYIEIRHVMFPNETRQALRDFTRDWLKYAETVMFCNLVPLSPKPRSDSLPIFKRCRAIRREISIGPEGQVPICMVQSWRVTTEEMLGDIHYATIQELWKHPRLQYLRKCHEDSVLETVPFCKECKEITE